MTLSAMDVVRALLDRWEEESVEYEVRSSETKGRRPPHATRRTAERRIVAQALVKAINLTEQLLVRSAGCGVRGAAKPERGEEYGVRNGKPRASSTPHPAPLAGLKAWSQVGDPWYRALVLLGKYRGPKPSKATRELVRTVQEIVEALVR